MGSRGKLLVSLCAKDKEHVTADCETDLNFHHVENSLEDAGNGLPSTSGVQINENENADGHETENESDSGHEYVPENEESSDSDEPLSKIRRRWTKSKPETWKRNITKEKRKSCMPYISKKENKSSKSSKRCKLYRITLCISHGPVDHALKGINENGVFDLPDKRGKKTPINKTPDIMLQKVKAHIESFPTMESHYCRKSSKRLYLDPNLSISKMYQLYVEQCQERKEKHVSEITYRRTFYQCEICSQFKNHTITEDDYKEHLRRRNEANAAKDADKIRATEDKTFLSVTFDLQSILQIPSSGVSQMYYSLKLCAYNFTIYEAAPPNNAFCYAWTEINGQRGSSEIGTALLKWIQNIPEGIKEISLYSDTCSGQNRNQFIAALFMYIVQYTNIQVLQHNFLEKGHFYMEVDSMHSAIETAKKNVDIYTMNDLLNIFKLARSKRIRNKKSSPYYVKELRFQDFLDLKSLASVFLKNRIKDDAGNKVSWLKIKYNYSELEYNVLRVYGREEKNSLLKLCKNNIIPPEYHAWYRSIPVDKKKNVTLPEPDSLESDEEVDSEEL
ncbi:hypothetical protein NQ314_013286 [Rhamnusium bicolor]|uniref:DUF7869 domain-containing protein n=1 Tax=Rhamnusium bicolor TaxID=1586634 RepID=A0AAV8X7V0_9CUCU|nr:hypothetical protein NQ314_013286 [Rhamnusium bicolor]